MILWQNNSLYWMADEKIILPPNYSAFNFSEEE